MDTQLDTIKKEIPQNTREAIKDALVQYYSGKAHSIQEAFDDSTDVSRSTYYIYKRDAPDEIETVSREARQIALRDRSDVQLAFDSEQLEVSVQVQRLASSIILGAVDELGRIARGEPGDFINKDGDETKLTPYPRDQIDAFRVLQELARGGVIPENSLPKKLLEAVAADRLAALQEPVEEEVEVEEEEEEEDILPILPVSAKFTSVVAKTADGTTVSVERGQVIDGEVIEVEED